MTRYGASRPVWFRLAALLLIPLVAMVGAITPQLLDTQRTRDAAAAVARETVDIERFIDLQAAIAREHLSTGAVLRIKAMGIPPSSAAAVLGFDPTDRLDPDRRAVQASAALVTGSFVADVPHVLERVDEIRHLADAPTVDIEQLQLEFDDLRGDVMDRIDLAVAQLTASGIARRAGGSPEIAVLGSVLSISRAGIEEVSAMSALLLSPTADHPAAHARLIGWIATFERGRASLGAISPEWDRRLDALAGDVRFAALDRALRTTAASTDEPGLSFSVVTDVLGAGGVYSAAMTTLATTATSSITVWAKQRADSASRDFTFLLVAAAATLVATAALGARSARLISRHLRRLATKAEHLSEGRLDEASGPPSGPREIATVGRALNDAVANLRHIEAQAAALATGRLDDASLERAAPGQLGALVHGSVGQLAGAWREREQLRARLQHDATHDRLTGLPNRDVALDALRTALRSGYPVAVLFVDLDGFKSINDAHGHLFGDVVLQHVADRLAEAVRRGDVLARIGGDEFVVVAAGVQSPAVATTLGDRLRASVSSITEVDGRPIELGACVGVAMSPEDGTDETALIGRADEAVYRAKRSGKDAVVLHGVG